MLSITTACEVT